ncbi:hypothetical protein QAD02_001203 [Eretmocerus hayati]|uniref:Uncharacterized protein n=1 Tax=Eretmocerus hayati TaxID=131215 RepID=A0ACC2NFT2_9HYME|nr:hypothetical protein QAD02_001203 [Eretmocerus hayati]
MLRIITIVSVSIVVLCSGKNFIDDNDSLDSIISYPFFATVLFNDEFACIGTILSQQHILTARVCIEGRTSQQMKVRVGSSNANNGGTIYPVKKLIGGNLEEESIGIIELENSINYDVNKAEAVEFFDFEKRDAFGSEATLVCLSNARFDSPRYLTTVNYKIVADEECNVEPIYRISEKKICAISLGQVAENCLYGVAGAPILVQGQLIGIFPDIFHPPQGRPEAYSNVLAYIDWIRENIGYEYVDH